MNILVAENITHTYRSGYRAVRGVSLSVNRGDFTTIIGPNGSGKTTIFRILSGFLKPTDGRVNLEGKDLFSLPPREIAKKISYLPQSLQVDFPFTCQQIVLMGRFSHLGGFGIEKENDLNIAKSAMEMTGVLHLQDRMIYEISGGERQRVFIAQAIAAKPEILMLDEPISSLDIKYRLQIMDLLKKLNREKGLTIIAIIHDLNFVSKYASNVLMLKEGGPVALGSPGKILTLENIKNLYGVKVKIVEESDSGTQWIIPQEIFTDKERAETGEEALMKG